MKSKILLFVFLILFIPVQAMSGDNSEVDPKMEKYKLTQEELHNLAVNYYKFMYGEEHEWKGINRKEGEDIIKDITPLKDGELTVAYMVNYNPDGHVQIIAHKNSYPFDRHGGGYYYFNVDSTIIKEIDIEDKWFHPIERGGLRMIRDRVINKVAPIAKEQVLLDKFLVDPDKFDERADFDKQIHPPKWWIEKKKPKNTKFINGLIDSEWNQS